MWTLAKQGQKWKSKTREMFLYILGWHKPNFKALSQKMKEEIDFEIYDLTAI